MHLLLVEDDPHLAPLLANALRNRYTVTHADTLQVARSQLKEQRYQLYVVDIGLPDGSGLTLLPLIRQRTPSAAILVLTAEGNVSVKVRALDSGADDYLTKPFSIREFEARLRALSRRAPRTEPIQLAGFYFDTANRVTYQGKRLPLSGREVRLLAALVSHAGHVVTRDQLADLFWEDAEVPGSNVLTVYVARLRRALTGTPAAHFIRTVPGLGYCFDPVNQEANGHDYRRSFER